MATTSRAAAADRSKHFSGRREPLQHHAALQLVPSEISGPLKFLNPTKAHFQHIQPKDPESALDESNEQSNGAPRLPPHEHLAENVNYGWTSRNNRKGRHQLVATPAKDLSDAKYLVPDRTNSFRAVAQTIGSMFTTYPYWDVSWLVAYIFTWGSIVWVINAFFVWLPLVKPSKEFKDEISTGGGVTAFIGATIFEIGSLFLMAEAVNENREGCFGWAVRELANDKLPGKKLWKLSPDNDGCTHHHTTKSNLLGRRAGALKDVEDLDGSEKGWVWFPSWIELKTHYFHELGFLACSAQLFGATIFWISGFTALPGILNHLSPGLEDGIYWTPQVIGGSGFIVSGMLFMVETQSVWYNPAFNVLGWHIGLWNLIGGMGFTLCPAFGYSASSWAQYQASLSTFWGSWAFLIGSSIQLYESLQKYPVDVVKVPDSDKNDGKVMPVT